MEAGFGKNGQTTEGGVLKSQVFLNAFSLGCINFPFRMHACDKWCIKDAYRVRSRYIHSAFMVHCATCT